MPKLFNITPTEDDKIKDIFKTRLIQNAKTRINPDNQTAIESEIFYRSRISFDDIIIWNGNGERPSRIGAVDVTMDPHYKIFVADIIRERSSLQNAAKWAPFILLFIAIGLLVGLANRDKNDPAKYTGWLFMALGGAALFATRFHVRDLSTSLYMHEIDKLCMKLGDNEYRRYKEDLNYAKENIDGQIALCNFGSISRETAKNVLYKEFKIENENEFKLEANYQASTPDFR